MQRSILDENISDTETLIEALPSPIQPVKLPEDQSTLVTNDIGTITQKKRLIVCCDGAWELSNSKSRIIPYSDTKLPRVSRSFYVENGKVGTQMVYYDAGLKTALPTDRYAGLFWRVRGRFASGLPIVYSILTNYRRQRSRPRRKGLRSIQVPRAKLLGRGRDLLLRLLTRRLHCPNLRGPGCQGRHLRRGRLESVLGNVCDVQGS